MKNYFSIIIILIITTSLTAQPVYVNADDYEKIEMGMTLEHVDEVLGVEGTIDTTVIYIWPENNLQAEWTDGKLSSYQTYSPMFEGENGYELLNSRPEGPMSNFLTYEEVVELIGTEGEKPDWVRYIWWVNEYKKIKVSFRDGKAFESSKF